MLKLKLRQYLEQKYPDHELARWFDPLRVTLDKTESAIKIAFPHALFGQWFMDSMGERFENDITHFSQGMRLIFEGNEPPSSKPPDSFIKLENTLRRQQQAAITSLAGRRSLIQVPLEHHRMSTFLVNKKNDFPFAVASRTVDNALQGMPPEYTPIVVYGQSGTGKTHFLGAMANALLDALPAGSVYYGGLDVLMRNRERPLLKSKALFLDDVQRVRLDPFMQEQLIAVLDASQTARSLVALCLDAHPSKCAGLDNKLLLRLTGGLVLELKKPDIEIRRKYIHRKNTDLSLGLNKNQELELAQRFQDFRSIDGAFSRVIAYRSLVDRKDTDLASILDADTEEKLLTASTIIKVTARFFSVNQEDLLGKSRNRKVTQARQVSMFLIRDMLGLSLVQVGRLFNGRDHSSVLYTIKKIKELQDSDNAMHKDISQLKQLCLSERF